MDRQRGRPIRSNLEQPQERFHVAERLRTADHNADGGGTGTGEALFNNTPVLPKDRAIRYFQSEPNAPLVRAEIERHVDGAGGPAAASGNAMDDDTIDSIDMTNFQNAHLAARIVAEQTQRRLQRQKELQQQAEHGRPDARGGGARRAPHGAAAPIAAATFSPRPKHSELGQQIKKLASASLAARQALSKGSSPPNSGRRRRGGGGGDGGGHRSKAALVAGPAFHLQEQVKALAKRRAQARKSGAEHERNLARQQASHRAEQRAEAQLSEQDRRAAELRRRERAREERRTARKDREAAQAREDVERHRRLTQQQRELTMQRRRDEQTRYISGVHQRLIDRFKVLRQKVPALCSCAKARGKSSGALASEPWKNCAANCPLYNNPAAYAQLVQQWFYAIKQVS